MYSAASAPAAIGPLIAIHRPQSNKDIKKSLYPLSRSGNQHAERALSPLRERSNGVMAEHYKEILVDIFKQEFK